jgi:hypothetical protein
MKSSLGVSKERERYIGTVRSSGIDSQQSAHCLAELGGSEKTPTTCKAPAFVRRVNLVDISAEPTKY